MALRIDKKALTFIYRYFIKGRTDARQIPYIPAKTRLRKKLTEIKMPRATPESKNVKSEIITQMLKRLENEESANVRCVGVWVDGSVICEASAIGYDFETWFLTHSMCKTITGLAIGMLIDDGLISIDTPVYTLFDDELPSNLGFKAKQITIRHLLTMSSGSTFNEVGLLTSEDWVRSFFEAPIDFEPGKSFAYNSMNTYMLSAIVKKVTGEGLSDFLSSRLFNLLGVFDYIWETCPKGIEKGGWGLYITPETMLKLGSLFVNKGRYRGYQIVSESWIEQMQMKQITVSDEERSFDYGYQMWVERNGECCLFNGMFGQNILVYPKKKIVVALTAVNSELFQRGKTLQILMKTFGGTDEAIYTEKRNNPIAYRELLRTQKSFFEKRRWITEGQPCQKPFFFKKLFPHPMQYLPTFFNEALGRTFYFEKNNLSFMPMIVSVMQNNLGEGLSELSFTCEGRKLFVLFGEGSESFKIRIGFFAPIRNEVDVRGEKYLISAWAQFVESEDGKPLMKIELILPELPALRRMELLFDDNGVSVSMLELPSKDVVIDLIENLKAIAPKSALLISLIKPQLEKEYVLDKISSRFEPCLYASRERKTFEDTDEKEDDIIFDEAVLNESDSDNE